MVESRDVVRRRRARAEWMRKKERRKFRKQNKQQVTPPTDARVIR